ncbi:MAG: hypothetical protein QW416_07030 [Candidatus Nitrosocaldaceae archaeon]
MVYSKDLALVSEISLCKRCMEREGLSLKNNKCSICNGLMDELYQLVDLINTAVKDYEFKTFQIGVTLNTAILEAEDEIRSRLKIKGRKSIKSDITLSLSKEFANIHNAKVAYVDADIYIHLDLRGRFVTVRGRSIYLYGKYKKYKRGIEQKKSICNNCKGKGCHNCNFKGSEGISVEEIISNHLLELYNADACKFAWIGGEDEDSLVLDGRPFFVKIVNPRKRSIRYDTIKINENGIEAWFTNIATKLPDEAIKFKSRFKVIAVTNDVIDEQLDIKVDTVKLSSKKVKSIYSLKANLLDKHTLEIELMADSGLPIKKFIEGGVEPNISNILKKQIICKYFDVISVELC